MWRTGVTPLGGLEHQCAVHQFIRVYGRRPTPEELVRCQNLPARPTTAAAIPAGARPSGALAGLLRREVARVIHRI